MSHPNVAPLTTPSLGCGVALRRCHYDALLLEPDCVDWIEVTSEDFFDEKGFDRVVLRALRREQQIALHGVSLSIGSVDRPDPRYLERLARLAEEIQPLWISDHLSWGRFGARHTHELLPLPSTEEALVHVVERIDEVQAILGRPLVLENISTYLRFKNDELDEWAFLGEVVKRTGCGVLLDLNNAFVNAENHGIDPLGFFEHVPLDRILEIHLAGPTFMDGYVLDTHDTPVPDRVWDLYRTVTERLGPIPTIFEWDGSPPPLAVMIADTVRARSISGLD